MSDRSHPPRGYFDHNATTPLTTAAREAWLDVQTRHWHNPSGLYHEAGAAKHRLEEVREAFADHFGVEPDRIVFHSGATEGVHAIMAYEARRTADGLGLCLGAVEHPCVRESARARGETLNELPVDERGAVDLDSSRQIIAAERPALVSVMAANNETGVLQPWRELADLCREHGARYHCDAAQWVGKMPAADFAACDWVTVSGHKFGGPKGVGLTLIPADLDTPMAQPPGGPQESGHRGGTESLADLAAMLAALRDTDGAFDPSGRDTFETALASAVPGARVIAADAPRLPNTSMAVMPAHANLKWLTRLSERGFAVSTGSACSAGRANPSHVMAAMGLDPPEMSRVLRFSGGRDTAPADWLALAEALRAVAESLDQRRRPTSKVNLEPR